MNLWSVKYIIADAANRWRRRVPAFDDFHLQPPAMHALASGR